MQANPFDQLLRKASGDPIVPHVGTKGLTSRIFELLAQNGRMTTRELADAVGHGETRPAAAQAQLDLHTPNGAKHMTPAEWKELQNKLNNPYGYAKLMVDGYTISLNVVRTSKTSLKYQIALYINGMMDFKFSREDCEERRRFWLKTVRHSYSPAKKAAILKGMNKRDTAWFTKELRLDQTYDFYIPWFPSFASLKKQLTQNNKDIQFHTDTEKEFGVVQDGEQVAP